MSVLLFYDLAELSNEPELDFIYVDSCGLTIFCCIVFLRESEYMLYGSEYID